MEVHQKKLSLFNETNMYKAFIGSKPNLKASFDSFQTGNIPENKENKNEKTIKILNKKVIGVTGLLLIATSLASAAFLHSRVGWFGEKARGVYKNLRINLEDLRKNKDFMSPFEKISFYVKEKTQNTLDFIFSFNQFKDRAIGKVLGPFKKKLDKVILYFRNAAIKTTKEKYNKLIISTNKMDKNLVSLVQILKKNGLDDDAKRLEDILKSQKIKNSIKNELIGGYTERIDNINENLREMVQGYDDLVKGNIPKSTKIKEILQEIPDSIKELGGIYKKLRDETVINARKNLHEPVKNTSAHIKELTNVLDEINEKVTNVELLKTVKKSSKDVNKVLKNINKSTEFEVDNLTNRLLDLDFDGGILEVASPVLALGLLGNEVRKADSVQERNSKFIKLGIPIIGGLAGWYYSAVIKCMSAATGIAFGLVTGYGFDKLGKVINNKVYNETNS